MKKSVFALILAFLAVSVSAETINSIREAYNEANKMIQNEELYRTEISVNSSDMSFPAVGIFNKSVVCYWACEPESDDFYRLIKVHCKLIISAFEEYTEVLYNDMGQPIFCYKKGGYGEQEDREERYYFSDLKLIRLISGGDTFDSPDNEQLSEAEEVLKEAENFYKAFAFLHSD